jgi:hypothetical protein
MAPTRVQSPVRDLPLLGREWCGYRLDQEISKRATEIIKTMAQYGFILRGDPARDAHFFFLPGEVGRTVPEPIDPPEARFCRELLHPKFIEPLPEAALHFQLSNTGLAFAANTGLPHGQ